MTMGPEPMMRILLMSVRLGICWVLGIGYWGLGIGCWILVTRYWLLVAGCWLLVAVSVL
jgi:hypothetical protein